MNVNPQCSGTHVGALSRANWRRERFVAGNVVYDGRPRPGRRRHVLDGGALHAVSL